MRKLVLTRRLLIGLAVTLLLAGCAASASQTTVPGTPVPAMPGPAMSAPTPTASTPTPSGVATAAATDRTYVSGTMGCDAVKETPIEGVGRPVRLTFDCTFKMSDPRVSGPQPMTCDEGFYDLPDLPGGVGIWDTCSMVLEGQGGTWKAVAAYGSEFMKSGTLRISGANIYEGQGAFAGLQFVALFSASPELTRLYGEGYHVSGWIEPAE